MRPTWSCSPVRLLRPWTARSSHPTWRERFWSCRPGRRPMMQQRLPRPSRRPRPGSLVLSCTAGSAALTRDARRSSSSSLASGSGRGPSRMPHPSSFRQSFPSRPPPGKARLARRRLPARTSNRSVLRSLSQGRVNRTIATTSSRRASRARHRATPGTASHSHGPAHRPRLPGHPITSHGRLRRPHRRGRATGVGRTGGGPSRRLLTRHRTIPSASNPNAQSERGCAIAGLPGMDAPELSACRRQADAPSCVGSSTHLNVLSFVWDCDEAAAARMHTQSCWPATPRVFTGGGRRQGLAI